MSSYFISDYIFDELLFEKSISHTYTHIQMKYNRVGGTLNLRQTKLKIRVKNKTLKFKSSVNKYIKEKKTSHFHVNSQRSYL